MSAQPQSVFVAPIEEQADWHKVFEARIRQNYANLEKQNFDPLVANWADDGVHSATGRSALGGTRRGRAAIRAWYERLGRLMPHAKYHLLNFYISGTVDDAVVVIRFDSSDVDEDGKEYICHGLHMMHIRNRQAVEHDIAWDTQEVAEFLAKKKAAGIAEAGADPIV